MTPISLYAPSHGIHPDILTQNPNDSLVTPFMGSYAASYGIYPDTQGQAPNHPPASSHGAYINIPAQTPHNPPVTPMGSYAHSRTVYPDIRGQTPNDPLVTSVTTLQAPLLFQNQIGRYQAESDASEEVWRNHHGDTVYAPSGSVYPDTLEQTQSYPSVTPVTTLQASLPFQTQLGRYQAESDAAEEVWLHRLLRSFILPVSLWISLGRF